VYPIAIVTLKFSVPFYVWVQSVFFTYDLRENKKASVKKAFGQLVLLGFDITVFTPAAYQPRSLRGPLKEI
jgi:hypothetical protein